MSTVSSTATPQAPAPSVASPSRRRVTGKQTFLRAAGSELVKLRTLRSTWFSSILALALTVLFGAGAAIMSSGMDGMEDQAAGMLVSGTTFGQIVVAVLGALVITGEYSSGQIRSTLAAVPRRSRSLLAKSLVVAGWAFLIGALSILLSWVIAMPFMGQHAPSFTDTHVLGLIWGTGLAYAGIAVMALGMGYLLRSTSGAITAVTILLFILQIPLSLLSMKWDWAYKVMALLPSQTVTAVVDPFSVAMSWADTNPSVFLTHTQGVLVFLAWATVPFLLGWAIFTRRDA